MKDRLVRFGIAIEKDLLAEIDTLVAKRGSTRSELFRDLARAEVGRTKVQKGVDAVATLTIVYDHHVRDLSERLTQLQHDLGATVRSTLHVHLSHDYCLEVLVLHGLADELSAIGDRILGTRGVKQGGIEIIAGVPHDHAHQHAHGHPHPHEKPRTRKPQPRASRRRRPAR